MKSATPSQPRRYYRTKYSSTVLRLCGTAHSPRAERHFCKNQPLVRRETGKAFINFLTVVARSGVPPEITRSQSNDTSAVIDALRVAMTDGQLAQNAYAITERYRAADSVGPAGYSERRKLIRSC